ncbi:MAG: kelch motif family protein [Chloroflexi bacterium]|nr:kelch motif family protein [Chloroflexota bacterium]
MRSSKIRATAVLLAAVLVSACGAGVEESRTPPGAGSPTTAPPTSASAPASLSASPAATPETTGGPGWSAAGSPAEARVGHTATLLADGRVLVVGGHDWDGAQAASVEVMGRTSAEVFDPATNTWTTTGAMATGRAFHTATLLSDGSVLVAGGGLADEAAARSAEIYDPETGRWSPAPSMAEDRFGHTATRLADGTVLVLGGVGLGSDPVARGPAALYDPIARTWTAYAAPSDARAGHTATLLGDGRLLMTRGGWQQPASAVLYDPQTGAWTEAGHLADARHGFGAARLAAGKVVVAGGGVGMADGVLASAEVYDPANGLWIPTGSMAIQRLQFTATALVDGRVLALGGGPASDAAARSAELYDPTTGQWSTTSSMASARFGHSATLLLDGSILVVGGYIGGGPEISPSAERFVPPAG